MKNYNAKMREINEEMNSIRYKELINSVDNIPTDEETLQRKEELEQIKFTLATETYLPNILDKAIERIEKRVSKSTNKRWKFPRKWMLQIEYDTETLEVFELAGFVPIKDEDGDICTYKILVNYNKYCKYNPCVLDNRNPYYKNRNNELIQAIIHELTHTFVFIKFKWNNLLINHRDESAIFMMWLAWFSEGKEVNGYKCWNKFKTTELYTDVLNMEFDELYEYTVNLRYMLNTYSMIDVTYKGTNIKTILQYSDANELNDELTCDRIYKFDDDDFMLIKLNLPSIVNEDIINTLPFAINSYVGCLVDSNYEGIEILDGYKFVKGEM